MLNLFSLNPYPFPLFGPTPLPARSTPAPQQARPAPLAGRSRLNHARDPASRPSSRSGPAARVVPLPASTAEADRLGPRVIPSPALVPDPDSAAAAPPESGSVTLSRAWPARQGCPAGLFKLAAAPWTAYLSRPSPSRLLRRASPEP
jgi:hypothetical protein